MIIPAYKITVTAAYRWDEITRGRPTYSLNPWGLNTLYYQGHDTPVQMDLAEGLYLAESNLGWPLIYGWTEQPDRGLDLDEAWSLGLAKEVEE